ncbi:hypothetical protein ACFPRL_03555 [Pseudoclavibacter helvolus]
MEPQNLKPWNASGAAELGTAERDQGCRRWTCKTRVESPNLDPRNASGSCELGPAGREWILRVRNRGTRVDPQNLHRRVGPVAGGGPYGFVKGFGVSGFGRWCRLGALRRGRRSVVWRVR